MKSENRLKNEKGSVLAYVLIFGMIILILVAGLATAANNGILFTQKSVESRQAYMDAKSVIEFGKIEINAWQKELSTAYDNLIAVLNNEDSTVTEIQEARAAITTLETKTYSIYGDTSNVSTSLNLSGSGEILGNVFLEKTGTSADTTDTSNYVFKVETQNLRRLLDYQVSYDYVLSGGTGSGSSGGSGSSVGITIPDPPDKPDTDDLYNPDSSSGWANTRITMPNWQSPVCYVNEEITGSVLDSVLTVDTHDVSGKENLYVTQFDWANEKPTLALTGKNICFSAFIANATYGALSIPISQANNAVYSFTATGEGTVTEPTGQLRFQGNYVQNNHETITMKAKYITFDHDLIMGSSANLNIICDTLYVKGDVNLNYPSGSYANLNIQAENVVIEGDLEVGSTSKVIMNCPNVWIDGDINTGSTTPFFEFNNINYLKAGNINLNNDCQFTVNGADSDSSQVVVGSIIPYASNSYDLNLSNLLSFTCTGLSLNHNSTLNINSNIVLMNGDFTLGPQAGNGEDSLLIETQYFDCSGITTIEDLKGDFLIKRIDYSEPLYVRFKGGYFQTGDSDGCKGVIIGEDSKHSDLKKDATMIVFGSPGSTISIPEDKVYLELFADDIYFDSDDIYITGNKDFTYESGIVSNDKTNLFIRSDVKEVNNRNNKVVDAGSFYDVKGYFPQMLNDSDPKDYVAPNYPNAPGSGGTSTVTPSPGSEKYY